MALSNHPGPNAHDAAIKGHVQATTKGPGQHRHTTGQFGTVTPSMPNGDGAPIDNTSIDGTASDNVYGQSMKP